MLKYSNEVPPSDDWFQYEYFDDEVNKKLDKTKGQLARDETEKETKNYVEFINQNPNWLKKISIENDMYLIICEYIDFFMLIYMQWSNDDSFISSFRKLIITRFPYFKKLT